jgi:hypothetical protein
VALKMAIVKEMAIENRHLSNGARGIGADNGGVYFPPAPRKRVWRNESSKSVGVKMK